MPEGDSLHRIASSLQALAGARVSIETPHPRAAGKGIAERLDGRVLESVQAAGKNLLLRFEGGLVLRSHLRMNGRWRTGAPGMAWAGTPWLVLRGVDASAALWHGPVLELVAEAAVTSRLGPDILAVPPDLDGMAARFRAADQQRLVGEAMLDQRLVAGIENIWRAEALWDVRVSPWLPLAEATDDQLRALLGAAHALMRASVEGRRPNPHVYRRAGRPCPRCGAAIRSRALGDDARVAYWCPACQRGGHAPAEYLKEE